MEQNPSIPFYSFFGDTLNMNDFLFHIISRPPSPIDNLQPQIMSLEQTIIFLWERGFDIFPFSRRWRMRRKSI